MLTTAFTRSSGKSVRAASANLSGPTRPSVSPFAASRMSDDSLLSPTGFSVGKSCSAQSIAPAATSEPSTATITIALASPATTRTTAPRDRLRRPGAGRCAPLPADRSARPRRRKSATRSARTAPTKARPTARLWPSSYRALRDGSMPLLPGCGVSVSSSGIERNRTPAQSGPLLSHETTV